MKLQHSFNLKILHMLKCSETIKTTEKLNMEHLHTHYHSTCLLCKADEKVLCLCVIQKCPCHIARVVSLGKCSSFN